MFTAVDPVEMTFALPATATAAREAIVQGLTARGGRIKPDEGGAICAEFGSSWKVRTLGAFLAGMEAMPRDVTVRMEEAGGLTQVSVLVEDKFGFGSRFGFAERLQQTMHDDAAAVKRLFEPL